MAHTFGNELRRMPIYAGESHEKRGEITVFDDGLVFEHGDFKMPLHKSFIESISVQRALAQSKFEVVLKYYNFMGSTMEMAFIVADEDYKFLSAKVGRK
ncbi:MAG: hypothetical protein N3G76_03200 [Candidatus Micrarchaeota archaeon]|nr:hypothetical protein [Candidatus Micrarchaeota archaeon]